MELLEILRRITFMSETDFLKETIAYGNLYQFMNGVFVEENHAWLRCKKPAICLILLAFYALPCIIPSHEIRSSRINRGSLILNFG